MRSRYARGAVEVRSRCGRGTLEVRSRYARGAVEVRSRCGRGKVEVRSRCGRGTLLVRFRCASGSLRVVNFLTGDTVYRSGYFDARILAKYPRILSITKKHTPNRVNLGAVLFT